MLFLLAALPIFILVFYCKKFDKLGDKKFEATWGSPYEGLRTDSRSVLFFPIFFLLRRYVFTASAFWVNEHGNMQINILILLTLISTAYLVAFKPFNSVLLQRLEVFNEVTSFALLYTCIYFTPYFDIEEHQEIRSDLGWVFNGFMVMNMSVHLFFLGRSSYLDCKKRGRARQFKKQKQAA